MRAIPDTDHSGRLNARLVAEVVLTALWEAARLLGGGAGKAARVDRAVIFLAILAHDLQVEERGAGGISVHALAMSFSVPFESARRHVVRLIADGWCRRVAGGIVVTPDAKASPAVTGLRATLHDLLVWLAEQHGLFDLPLPRAHAATGDIQRTTTIAALELVLAGVDFAAGSYVNLRDFYVVHWVMCDSVAAVTTDPVLARRYGAAATVPGGEHRRPVRVRRLATTLGLPFSTLRRYVGHAVAVGTLERHGRGVRASEAFLGGEAIQSEMRFATLRIGRAFQRLARAGFDFAAPGECYINARPARSHWTPPRR